MKIQIIERESILYLVDRLENFEKDKAIRAGLRAATSVFLSGGRRRLNQRIKKGAQGHLRGSFATLVKRNRPGALAGFRRGFRDGNHAHLVDRGTRVRYNRNGAHRGVMPANSFWEDTRNMDQHQAMERLYEGVQKAVERINNRQ